MGDAEPEARARGRCAIAARAPLGALGGCVPLTVCEVAPRVTRTVHAVVCICHWTTGDQLSQGVTVHPFVGRLALGVY